MTQALQLTRLAAVAVAAGLALFLDAQLHGSGAIGSALGSGTTVGTLLGLTLLGGLVLPLRRRQPASGAADELAGTVEPAADPSPAQQPPAGSAHDLATAQAAAAAPSPNEAETALQCLVAVARRHRVEISVGQLRHAHGLAGVDRLDAAALIRIARKEGLKARAVELAWSEFIALGEAYPVLVQLSNGNWVEVHGATNDAVLVRDPLAETAAPFAVERERFARSWPGIAVMLKAGRRAIKQDGKFSFRWFVPELMKEWRLFADVAVAAVVLYALALVMPVFFQLVIDKVLVHEGYATLYVLAAGAGLALAFEALFSFLRRYLLLYATSRTDVRVASRTFAHLLSLPISFFEQSSAGVLVKHMQQGARVRDFLTGRLFLTLLDAMSLFVFLPLLLMYSVRLTLIVLAFAGIIGVVVAALVGPFRRRLLALYRVEAERQALLVETVHGMRTVKSLAMEPAQARAWNDSSAESVAMRYRVEKVSAAAHAVTGLLEKLMSLAIVGLGALDVFDGSMTIGALVAFNMLAGRVSQPLVQLVTMAHEYQEVALAVQMLGEIMNRKSEREDMRAGLEPAIEGEIEFDAVSFRYGDDTAPALDDISFTIAKGSMFGIVGRSGSGKTTLTRLMQGLYPVQQGLIRVDGFDVREVSLMHLRRSIGVVLQDNFLFKGTVRENIAAVKPGASIDEVARAARLAGALEFIERLPRGFETMLEENGANLSGGQKQRLAIARALINDPRILIFDEATSALDPESERIIRDNLRKIAAGRTVIIVSHRLSSLTGCDQILVIDRGQVADLGRHDQLLSRCTTYRHLWNQQTRQSA